MAESVVASVSQYLGGLLIQEGTFLGGVEDEIVKIQDEMKRMQCFLKDADARQDESEVIRNRVSEIKDLAYDVEDAIGNYILKAKYANFLDPKKYIRLHEIGKEIGMLQSRIQDITRSVETYGFKTTGEGEGMSSTTEMRRLSRQFQSYPHYDDEDVIGMEDNMKVLVTELINRKGPRLVSIVGMGGLGKTTLAKKVYNHGDVKHHFDCCSWSFISQQLKGRAILQGIIRKVGNPNEVTGLEALNDGELTEKLYKLMEDKRYLVVFDDIWNTNAWDVLRYAFPKGKMGSKILLTTRNKEVARYVDPSGFLHEPACLTEEESWELFCKKASFRRNVASTSSSLYPPDTEVEKKEKLGKSMIKKCGGLPLAVVVLGGLLATKQSIHEWEMVSKDIGRHMNKPQQKQEQYSVIWILSLSYQDLPFYLKPCFLYLGLYPEDTEFHRRELIQMWIAEGFMRQFAGQGSTMEKMGEEYLLELINRSMVQVSKRSFRGKVKTCRLHDLMRDLCLQKAKEENFLYTFDGRSSTTGDSSSSTSEVESISKGGRMYRHAIHNVSMQQLPTRRSPHLRALFLWRPISNVESIAKLKFVFKEFNFLKVLVLENLGNIGSLPKAIGKLIHLRNLRLIAVHEIEVPVSIGNLQSLQFLTLCNIKRLPNVLWKMERLTYCCVREAWSNSKLVQVDGLKNLTSLELSVWGIKKLQLGINLRKLVLHDIDGEDCKSLHRFSLSRADRLQCLSLCFQSDRHMSDDYDWSPLSCCRSLWKLHLSMYLCAPLKRLPIKLEEFPPNLTKLSLLVYWLEEDPIPTLEMLPNLETLTLGGYALYHAQSTTKYYFSSKGFGRLQYLRLLGDHLYPLEELEVQKGALPCLVHLQIRNCRRLRMLPEGLRFITSLKKLEVIDMKDEFNKRLREDGDDWHKIQHIPSIIIRYDTLET